VIDPSAWQSSAAAAYSNCHTMPLPRFLRSASFATVDIDAARAQDFQVRYRADVASTDFEAILARPDVDAVVVTTANDLHAPLALQALAAGKHVLVQKPMALSLGEADQMIDAAARANKKLMVSFFEFFHPAFRRAKELVDAGVIGDVFFYKAIMAWHVPSMEAWRFDPRVSGGGVIMDGHVHHVAYLLHLLDNPHIDSVYAEYGALNSTAQVEDTAVTLLRTPRVLAVIDGSNRLQEPNAQMGRMFKESVEIFGSNGTIRIFPTERPSLSVYVADATPGEGLEGGWVAPRLEPVCRPCIGRTPITSTRTKIRGSPSISILSRPARTTDHSSLMGPSVEKCRRS